MRPLHRFILITAFVIFILGASSFFNFQNYDDIPPEQPPAFDGAIIPEEIVLSSSADSHRVYSGNDESSEKTKPWWFIGTVSPAHSIQRRAIIRATWQKYYRDDNTMKLKFFISNTTELWRPVVQFENQTYGDIVELSNISEEWRVANSIKTIHMYKYIQSQGEPYEWVSKIDDDSFLDVPAFLRAYLLPRMDMHAAMPTATVNHTMIGRKLYAGPAIFAGGQFYTMTWDLMTKISELWTSRPFNNLGEDELNGRLLYDAKIKWELIPLSNPIAFDYSDSQARGDGTAWVDENDDVSTREWIHAVGPGAINPHKMKEDDAYLRVAACYNETGLRERPPLRKGIR